MIEEYFHILLPFIAIMAVWFCFPILWLVFDLPIVKEGRQWMAAAVWWAIGAFMVGIPIIGVVLSVSRGILT